MPALPRLFHNPRCSKSRAALALLQQHGADFTLVDYLKSPPTTAELAAIAAKLGSDWTAMVRRKEALAAGFDPDRLSQDSVIGMLARHPEALERPILETATRAAIGRPPEKILELLVT